MDCVQCRGLGGRASPSGVYPAGGLRGSFTCGGGEEGLWTVSWVEGLGACGLYPKSRDRRALVLSSEVYPAAKFHWHCTCGFEFRHSLWLPFVTAFAVLKGLTASTASFFLIFELGLNSAGFHFRKYNKFFNLRARKFHFGVDFFCFLGLGLKSYIF